MSLTGTTVSMDYFGDGSLQIFPIPFVFFNNTQVNVKKLDTLTNIETILIQGTDFTVIGGNPGVNTLLGTAPLATDVVTVYRVTPKTQPTDYIETGKFPAEAHEQALDRIVMMLQELDAGIVSSTIPGGGQYARLNAQSVASGGTVSIGIDQRMVKKIQGAAADQTASATVPIAAGSIDAQELLLVGADDDLTLTLLQNDLSNIRINGDMTFKKNSTLELLYDLTDAIWIEIARKE